MSMNDLLEAFILIEKNIELCDFCTKPHSEEILKKAEHLLNTNFPPTYRMFLKKYGCGGIGSFEVEGIINENFEANGIRDGIGLTYDERLSNDIPSNFIYIADVGDGFYYYLDSSQPNADGEYPVVIWGHGLKENQKEKVNEDFGEFLLEQVKQALEDD